MGGRPWCCLGLTLTKQDEIGGLFSSALEEEKEPEEEEDEDWINF